MADPVTLTPSPTWNYPALPPRRERLWIKEGKKCHWCGRPTRLALNRDGTRSWDHATVDHVVPRSKGGGNDDDNLVSACNLCNNRRGHEDQCGLAEGTMLGRYDPDRGMLYRGRKTVTPSPGKRRPEEILREQRDQAQREIARLDAELKSLGRVIVERDAEIGRLQAELAEMTMIRLARTRIAEWLRPK